MLNNLHLVLHYTHGPGLLSHGRELMSISLDHSWTKGFFFVIVDAHSEWPEVYEMPSTTAQKTVDMLRHVFATFGLPQQLVLDNGPQFVAAEISEFFKQNGVKHICCNLYHLASNWLAERFVRCSSKLWKLVELKWDLFIISWKTLFCIVAQLLIWQQDTHQHYVHEKRAPYQIEIIEADQQEEIPIIVAAPAEPDDSIHGTLPTSTSASLGTVKKYPTRNRHRPEYYGFS